MPHVVVVGARALSELVAGFAPIDERIEDCIVKVEHAYLERGGRLAHFPALTVRGPLRQQFLVLARLRDDDVVVRLDPLTDPEKTRPVHLALALVARTLRRASPGAEYGPTNIADAVASAESVSGEGGSRSEI